MTRTYVTTSGGIVWASTSLDCVSNSTRTRYLDYKKSIGKLIDIIIVNQNRISTGLQR